MKKTALIYARVSTIDRQDYSRQVNDLTELIVRHGFSENQIEVFEEKISVLKRNDERPELTRMLNLVEKNPEDYIIYTTEISRIGRDPSDTRKVIDRLTDLKVPVYIKTLQTATVNENGERNATMSIILQVLIEYANMELQTFKERSKSGMRNKSKMGKWLGGVMIPYGYYCDENKFLHIEPEESEIIKRIFKLYSDGFGIKVISNILNADGVLTRTNKTHENKTLKFRNFPKLGSEVKWSDKQVHDILRNTIYKGNKRYKGEIFDAPVIIKDTVFDLCTDIMNGKTHRNYLTKYVYLLKDKLKCGKCGRNYFAKFKPVRQGDKVYICSSRLNKNGNCGNVGVNISLIESALYYEFVNSPSMLKYIQNQDNQKENIENSLVHIKKQLIIKEKDLTKKNREQEKLLDLYLTTSTLSQTEFQNKKNKIENELSNIEESVVTIKKEIFSKERILENMTDEKITKEHLISIAKKRNELVRIFNQFISKVVFVPLSYEFVLATVWFQINEEVIYPTVKLLLDIKSIKKKTPIYRYQSVANVINEPEFENDVMLTPVSDILKYLDISFPQSNWVTLNSTLNVIDEINIDSSA